MTSRVGDSNLTTDLVMNCCNTCLESLAIGNFLQIPRLVIIVLTLPLSVELTIDLFKVTKLKGVSSNGTCRMSSGSMTGLAMY